MIFIHLKNRAEPKKLYSVFSYATLSKLTINCSKQDAFLRVLGERLNSIQEVKSSILSVSTTVHRTILFLPAFRVGVFYDKLKISLLSSIMVKRWCCYEYGRKN